MDCKDAMRLLEPYLDGELDRDEARGLEAHVDGCAECRAALAELGRLRHAVRSQAPRYTAPASLRQRIRSEDIARPSRAPRSHRMPAWWRLAAACFFAFLAGSLLTWAWRPAPADGREQVARDLFASHWRALAATSPVDVVSSDRHTVRPWFAGKLPQAPLVRDFVDQGFALVGGRIDYAGSERIPVLVYRHDKHLIDVFVLSENTPVGSAPLRREGYTLVWGTLDDQKAAIVSDLDGEELARFRNLLDGAK
ncbi:MAG TPA: zf-HC2 domain-containing protein [Rhodanobacteraceae bacterium]|nr:zf-HC2 domain-containing protein [Rhodanobacteraceae bacterium]